MIWHRLKFIVIAGTAIILAVVAAGTAVLLDRAERAALTAADASLERSARAVENTLNRQLLQVHGALASIPTLFDAANATPRDTAVATELLRSLNFQTLAYRDLLLVGADGTVLVAARSRGLQRPLPIDALMHAHGPTTLVGPFRNSATGDWSLYVSRSVPGWDDIRPVAEVPLSTLMGLLAETTGLAPGMRILLERPNGQLIASLPHDELQTGHVREDALGGRDATGKAFMATDPVDGKPLRAVVRATLYPDVRVVVTESRDMVLADWRRDRDRMLVSVALGGLLITAFAGALIFALRLRERADAERHRAASVLANAIEAMSDGFAMWDDDDRLITCNKLFRDLYALDDALVASRIRYADMISRGVRLGQFSEPTGDAGDFGERLAAWHKQATGALERRLPDGRWVLVKERRTADGGIVGIRTDITTLKSTLAELAEANARANEATAEARRRNAALAERESRIRFLAHHDDLTRLPNRVLFRTRLEEALSHRGEGRGELAVLYLDLDRFKDVNDTLGHQVGDALLRAAALRLKACVNNSETVARLGGDEFAILSLALKQPEAAETLAARVIKQLSEPYSVLGHTIVVSVSVGIAAAGAAGENADTLLKHADLALYQAKANCRGTACVFAEEMDVRLRARLEMETDLRHALKRNQFSLVYQPIYQAEPECLSGFEALLRWHHPAHGVISPDIFIPLAEDTRLIIEIGYWVIRQACADAMFLPEELTVAINLSPIQLAGDDIVAAVREALEESGLDPGRLELEITETALFADDQRNLEAIRSLKEIGVRIVLDDFGAGYSSLSHLRLFQLDKIKIDRSFVWDMTEGSDSAAIIETIATLARRLGMVTTAEGIETAAQWDAVRRVGCTQGQGFFLGIPAPIDVARRVAVDPGGAQRDGMSRFGDVPSNA